MKKNTVASMEEAVQIMEENLETIDRVSEWAEVCGYTNAKTFSRQFRNFTGIRPAKMMKEIKIKKAIELLSNGANLNNYEIALRIGKKDEQALYHFIVRQTGNAPEFYKRKK